MFKILNSYKSTLGILVIATLLTLPIIIYLSNLEKYSISDLKLNIPNRQKYFIDLNKNGLDESLFIVNQQYQQMGSFYYTDERGVAQDQFNFPNSVINRNSIYFFDSDNNGTEEIYTVFEQNDSIFIEIVDPLIHTVIHPKLFITSKPDKIYADNWDVTASIAKIQYNSNNELIAFVYLNSAFAQIPRGILKFNITKKIITGKLLTGCAPHYISFKDINSDTKEEIIFFSTATFNNVHLEKQPLFPDDRAWIIVLDENLDTLFSISEGNKYSGAYFTTSQCKDSSFIYITSRSQNDSVDPNLSKYTSSGHKIKSISLSEDASLILNDFVQMEKCANIFVVTKSRILIFDKDLNKIDQIKLPSKFRLTKYFYTNLDSDKDNELVLFGDGIIVLDGNQIALSHKFVNYYLSHSIIKKDGLNKIVLNSTDGHSEFTIKFVDFFEFRLLFAFLAFVLIIISLIILRRIIRKISLLILTFKHFSAQSKTALIVINKQKSVIFINQSAKELFNYNSHNKSIYSLFDNNALPLIEESLSHNNKYSTELFYSTGASLTQFSYQIVPLKFFRYLFGYLMQFENRTEELQKERMRTLSHSIQKVAHEIKTPSFLCPFKFRLAGAKLRFTARY